MSATWIQVLQVVAAVLVGAIFGLEREIKNKPAGLTTFALVCVGSCLIAILQQNIIAETVRQAGLDSVFANTVKADSGRLIAQVVSGIGFLGAGVIVYTRDVVRGVTTAALLWLVAAMGLMIGIGGMKNYIVVAAALIITFGFSLFSKLFKHRFAERRKSNVVKIVYNDLNQEDFLDFLEDKKILVKKQYLTNTYIKNGIHYTEKIFYFSLTNTDFHEFVKSVALLDYVFELSEL